MEFRRVLIRSDEALRKAGVVPGLKVQVALSITGIVLAYHDAGVALVEPFLIETLGLTGLVARPFSPEIAVETLLVRHRSTPPSRLAGAFTAHFKRLLKRPRRNYRTVCNSLSNLGSTQERKSDE